MDPTIQSPSPNPSQGVWSYWLWGITTSPECLWEFIICTGSKGSPANREGGRFGWRWWLWLFCCSILGERTQLICKFQRNTVLQNFQRSFRIQFGCRIALAAAAASKSQLFSCGCMLHSRSIQTGKSTEKGKFWVQKYCKLSKFLSMNIIVLYLIHRTTYKVAYREFKTLPSNYNQLHK